MKNKILLLMVMLLSFTFLKCEAQGYYYIKSTSTGPEYQYNYFWTIIMQSSSVGVALGDTLSAWQTLPFAWKFYGKPVTGFYISNNGYITFDKNAKKSKPNNIAVPDTNAPKNAIFALWDNLQVINTNANSSFLIHKWTYGAAPNRVQVIHWYNLRHKNNQADADAGYFFAIRIFESGQKSFDIVHDRKVNSNGTTSATVGIQDSTGTTGMMMPTSPNYVFPSLTYDQSDDVVFEFYTGIQPQYDMSMISINMPSYLKTSYTIPLKGTIRNLGSQTVTSFTINYSLNGGTPVSQNINSVNIVPGAYYNLQTPADWVTPDSEKVYKMVMWATNINGNPDEDTHNDSTSTNIQIIANSTQRIPLHEVFTSSTCGPCAAGNANLKSIFDANDGKFCCVKYQMYYPGNGDPYYTSECGDRSNFYGGINSIPRLEVDGGWNGNPGGYDEVYLDSFYAVPAFVNLSGHFDINVTTKKIEVYPTFTALSDFTTTNLKLFIAVVENTTYKNVGTNGESEFNWVMKKMIPNSSGATISTMKKNAVTNLSKRVFTFPGSYRLPPDATQPININTENSVEDFNNLSVIIWIQNTATREILQSAWATNTNSIEDQTQYEVSVYPNPISNEGKIVINLPSTEKVSYDIYNMFGQVVYSSGESVKNAGKNTCYFNSSKFSSGVYVLRMQIGDKSISRTIVK